VGGAHARFSDFLYRPRRIWEYARTLSKPSAWAFVGHTPLGGVAVFLILLCLLVQTGTGLFANDDIATEGPWANRVGKDTSDFLTSIHAYSFDVLLMLVAGHVAVVFYYLLRKRHNLIVPMLTGYKTLAQSPARARRVAGMNGRAMVVLGVALVSVWLFVRTGGG
jgi:cytochrome b